MILALYTSVRRDRSRVLRNAMRCDIDIDAVRLLNDYYLLRVSFCFERCFSPEAGLAGAVRVAGSKRRVNPD